MTNLTNQEYWTEVNATANYVIELTIESLQCDDEDVTIDNIQDRINDCILHQQIDSHQYAIYNAYHLPILQYSDNAEYMIDNFGGESVEHAMKQGVSSLFAAMAFWAFYADVSDLLTEDVIEEAIEALELTE